MGAVASTVPFAGVVVATSVLGVVAARRARSAAPPSLDAWALGRRVYGGVTIWFLLGSTVYTAYTFTAVPGITYSSGALGYFALPYTILVYPLAFLVLPRLWRVARAHDYVTLADLVRGRYGSPTLALLVALTGVLATMPYLALQLVGIRAVLEPLGVRSDGLLGDAFIVVVFGVLAIATYRSGMAAPRLVSYAKGGLIVFAAGVTVVFVGREFGGPGHVFDAAADGFARLPGGSADMLVEPGSVSAYVSLALGSALAMFLYPHVITTTFAARSDGVLRRASVSLLGWTALLGVFGLLGVAAVAAGIRVPPGRGELAVPFLVEEVTPGWLAGVVFGALAVGALVPAATMSIGAATLFARNIYAEYIDPTATHDQETRVARLVSLFVKVGALAFVLGLQTEDAINLQLLGGVWIMQTLPAVAFGLVERAPHKDALMAGWVVGMVAGTALVTVERFMPLVPIGVGSWQVHLYAAFAAVAANLVIVGLVSPILDRLRVPRGIDETAAWRSRRDSGLVSP